jgi:hypothetical protein
MTTRKEFAQSKRKEGGSRALFVINRVLILLAVFLTLAGLFFDQWRIVLRNAILL